MRKSKNPPLWIITGLLAFSVFSVSVARVHAQLSTCSASFVPDGTTACFAQATQYKMKLHAFRLSTDGDINMSNSANVATLTSSVLDFNVGSNNASPGAQVGTWASGATVLPGTYTHFIMEVGTEVTVSGDTVTVSGGGQCNASNVVESFTVTDSSDPAADLQIKSLEAGTKMRMMTKSVTGLPLTVHPIGDPSHTDKTKSDVLSIDIEINSNLGAKYTFPTSGNCTGKGPGVVTVNKFDLSVTHP